MVEVKDKSRKCIADIRLYGQRGLMLTEYFGLSLFSHRATYRMACKLRERQFALSGKIDHLYVFISPYYKTERIFTTDERVISVEFPLTVEDVPKTESAQFGFIVQLIQSAMNKVGSLFPVDLDLVQRTANDLLREGDDLEIVQCSDENSEYAVEVIFKIKGELPTASEVFLRVLTKSTGARRDQFLLKVELYDEVFELFSRVKIARNVVRFVPKTSVSAKATLAEYASLYTPSIALL